jgi:hypothetical protein
LDTKSRESSTVHSSYQQLQCLAVTDFHKHVCKNDEFKSKK